MRRMQFIEEELEHVHHGLAAGPRTEAPGCGSHKSPMPQPTQETIHALLVKNVPREVVMGVEDALAVGAYVAARGMDEGHLPHVVGQLRHFHMNEAFQRALAANGAEPSPIRGNGIVTGRTGVFTLARFNIPEGFWINGRRSRTRKQMSLANMAIEPLVQPELFSAGLPPLPWLFGDSFAKFCQII